jgi:hypothetical protein
MITINQSLIKQFILSGNVIPHCPKFIYYVSITRQIEQEDRLCWQRGNFFEHKALGYPGRAPSLPRHKTTGKKTVVTQRIEAQAERFKQDAQFRQIEIQPLINTQVSIVKRWERNPNVILKGTLDIFPTPYMNDEGEIELAIIDTKYTGNLKNDFGQFGWGNPANMDHLQLVFYWYLAKDIDFDLNDKYVPDNYLRELIKPDIKELLDAGVHTARYMIYDGTPEMNAKNLRVEPTPDKIQEMHESIRKTVSYIRDYNDAGWPAIPDFEVCKNCPIINCKSRTTEEII